MCIACGENVDTSLEALSSFPETIGDNNIGVTYHFGFKDIFIMIHFPR